MSSQYFEQPHGFVFKSKNLRQNSEAPQVLSRALRLFRCRQEPFALEPFSGKLALPAHGLGLLAGPLLRRLFIAASGAHFAKKPLALHLLLQHPKGLLDIVVSNRDLQIYLHGVAPTGALVGGGNDSAARPFRRANV